MLCDNASTWSKIVGIPSGPRKARTVTTIATSWPTTSLRVRAHAAGGVNQPISSGRNATRSRPTALIRAIVRGDWGSGPTPHADRRARFGRVRGTASPFPSGCGGRADSSATLIVRVLSRKGGRTLRRRAPAVPRRPVPPTCRSAASSGSLTSRRSAAAMLATGSCGSASSTASAPISRVTGVRPVMTGVPAAIASRTGRPKPSSRLG